MSVSGSFLHGSVPCEINSQKVKTSLVGNVNYDEYTSYSLDCKTIDFRIELRKKASLFNINLIVIIVILLKSLHCNLRTVQKNLF